MKIADNNELRRKKKQTEKDKEKEKNKKMQRKREGKKKQNKGKKNKNKRISHVSVGCQLQCIVQRAFLLWLATTHHQINKTRKTWMKKT